MATKEKAMNKQAEVTNANAGRYVAIVLQNGDLIAFDTWTGTVTKPLG